MAAFSRRFLRLFLLFAICAAFYSFFFSKFIEIRLKPNVQQFLRPFLVQYSSSILDKTMTSKPLIVTTLTGRSTHRRGLDKAGQLKPKKPTLMSPKVEMGKYFEKIYKQAVWGKFDNRGFSGGGSMPSTTVEYRKFLETFFVEKNIKRVLDIPCGLWSFMNLLHWGPVRSYVGLDIVKDAIDYNVRKFGENGTERQWRQSRNETSFDFDLKSLTDADLPPADVLICKDAFQHLPLSVAQTFLKNAFPNTVNGSLVCKYKFLLITNDICVGGKRMNPDIPKASADSYCRDFSKPPFSLEAPVVFRFPRVPKCTQLIDLTQMNCSLFL